METFTDDTLIQIIQQRLSDTEAAQLELLLEKGNQSVLTSAEKNELEFLVAAVGGACHSEKSRP